MKVGLLSCASAKWQQLQEGGYAGADKIMEGMHCVWGEGVLEGRKWKVLEREGWIQWVVHIPILLFAICSYKSKAS